MLWAGARTRSAPQCSRTHICSLSGHHSLAVHCRGGEGGRSRGEEWRGGTQPPRASIIAPPAYSCGTELSSRHPRGIWLGALHTPHHPIHLRTQIYDFFFIFRGIRAPRSALGCEHLHTHSLLQTALPAGKLQQAPAPNTGAQPTPGHSMGQGWLQPSTRQEQPQPQHCQHGAGVDSAAGGKRALKIHVEENNLQKIKSAASINNVS